MSTDPFTHTYELAKVKFVATRVVNHNGVVVAFALGRHDATDQILFPLTRFYYAVLNLEKEIDPPTLSGVEFTPGQVVKGDVFDSSHWPGAPVELVFPREATYFAAQFIPPIQLPLYKVNAQDIETRTVAKADWGRYDRYRSTTARWTPNDLDSFEVFSDGISIWLFRASVAATSDWSKIGSTPAVDSQLLYDRFTLISGVLYNRTQARYRDSKRQGIPQDPKTDHVSVRDIHGADFYEPTTIVGSIRNLSHSFAILQIPGKVDPRWGVFTYKEKTGNIHLYTLPRDKDGGMAARAQTFYRCPNAPQGHDDVFQTEPGICPSVLKENNYPCNTLLVPFSSTARSTESAVRFHGEVGKTWLQLEKAVDLSSLSGFTLEAWIQLLPPEVPDPVASVPVDPPGTAGTGAGSTKDNAGGLTTKPVTVVSSKDLAGNTKTPPSSSDGSITHEKWHDPLEDGGDDDGRARPSEDDDDLFGNTRPPNGDKPATPVVPTPPAPTPAPLPPALPSLMCVLAQDDATRTTSPSLYIRFNSTDKSKVTFILGIEDTAGNITKEQVFATNVRIGRWSHIALTYQGAYTLFVDGISAGTFTFGDKGPGKLSRIGKTNSPTPLWLSGSMDEIRLWSIPLSQQFIRSHKDQRINSAQPHLMSYWRCDEAYGDVAHDLLGKCERDFKVVREGTGEIVTWVPSSAALTDPDFAETVIRLSRPYTASNVSISATCFHVQQTTSDPSKSTPTDIQRRASRLLLAFSAAEWTTPVVGPVGPPQRRDVTAVFDISISPEGYLASFPGVFHHVEQITSRTSYELPLLHEDLAGRMVCGGILRDVPGRSLSLFETAQGKVALYCRDQENKVTALHYDITVESLPLQIPCQAREANNEMSTLLAWSRRGVAVQDIAVTVSDSAELPGKMVDVKIVAKVDAKNDVNDLTKGGLRIVTETFTGVNADATIAAEVLNGQRLFPSHSAESDANGFSMGKAVAWGELKSVTAATGTSTGYILESATPLPITVRLCETVITDNGYRFQVAEGTPKGRTKILVLLPSAVPDKGAKTEKRTVQAADMAGKVLATLTGYDYGFLASDDSNVRARNTSLCSFYLAFRASQNAKTLDPGVYTLASSQQPFFLTEKTHPAVDVSRVKGGVTKCPGSTRLDLSFEAWIHPDESLGTPNGYEWVRQDKILPIFSYRDDHCPLVPRLGDDLSHTSQDAALMLCPDFLGSSRFATAIFGAKEGLPRHFDWVTRCSPDGYIQLKEVAGHMIQFDMKVTIEFWARIDTSDYGTFSESITIFQAENKRTGTSAKVLFRKDQVQPADQGQGIGLYVEWGTRYGAWDLIGGGSNVWHHYAFTIGDDRVNCFIDGNRYPELNTVPTFAMQAYGAPPYAGGPLPLPLTEVQVGHSNSPVGCMIAELRVHNIDYDQSHIQTLMKTATNDISQPFTPSLALRIQPSDDGGVMASGTEAPIAFETNNQHTFIRSHGPRRAIGKVNGRYFQLAPEIPLGRWSHLAVATHRPITVKLGGSAHAKITNPGQAFDLDEMTLEFSIRPLCRHWAYVFARAASVKDADIPYRVVYDQHRLVFSYTTGQDDKRQTFELSIPNVTCGESYRVSIRRLPAFHDNKIDHEVRYKLVSAQGVTTSGVVVHKETGMFAKSDSDAWIGGIETNSTFQGELSEIRLFKKYLDEDQLYMIDPTPLKAYIAAWWKCQDPVGEKLTDEMGGHHAKLNMEDAKAEVTRCIDQHPLNQRFEVRMNGLPVSILPIRDDYRSLLSGTKDKDFSIGYQNTDAWHNKWDQGGATRLGAVQPTFIDELRIWNTFREGSQILSQLYNRLPEIGSDIQVYFSAEQYDPTKNVWSDAGTFGLSVDGGDLDPAHAHHPDGDIPLQPKPLSPRWAPVGSEPPEIQYMFKDDATFDTGVKARLIDGSMGVCEYGNLDLARSEAIGDWSRCFGLVNEGKWILRTGFKTGDIEADLIGQTAKNPILIGYIEGGPPIPAENYDDKSINSTPESSVSVVESEECTYTYTTRRERGYEARLDGSFSWGFEWNARAEAVVASFEASKGMIKTTMKGAVQFSGGTNNNNMLTHTLISNKTHESQSLGRWKDRMRFANIGTAIVEITPADLYAMRLKLRDRKPVVGYRVMVDPSAQRFVNTIQFKIDPKYTKQGTLDGRFGFDPNGVTDWDEDYKYAQHDKNERSYYRPLEVAALEAKIDAQRVKQKADYDNYLANVQPVGGLKPIDWGDGVGPASDYGSSNYSRYSWSTSGNTIQQDQSINVDSKEFTANTHFREQFDVGINLESTILGIGPGGSVDAMQATQFSTTRTKDQMHRAALEVVSTLPHGGVLVGNIDNSGTFIPVLGSVRSYAWTTFYLEQDRDNLDVFFNQVVDPIWLQDTNDVDAVNLSRIVRATDSPGCWRVMHRVKYVSRQVPSTVRPPQSPSTMGGAITTPGKALVPNSEMIRNLLPLVVIETNSDGDKVVSESVVRQTLKELYPALGDFGDTDRATVTAIRGLLTPNVLGEIPGSL